MARKSFSYDPKTGRFRDAAGHFISKARALRSSIARQQYESSQRKRKKPSKPAPSPRRPVAKPAPRPPRRQPAARRTFTFDLSVGRFRDATGKIISKTRGLRSAVARAQYEAAQRKKPKKPRVTKKPAPPKKKPPKRIKPRRRVRPLISESAKAPGQFTVENVQTLSHEELAEMLLTQVTDGYKRFRFWYKMKTKSVDYPQGIGSTQPLWWTVLTGKKPSLERTIAFVKGHYGWILGKITMYWMSKR